MITSTKNQRISYVKKLFDKKFRRQEKKYVAEGLKMVRELVFFGIVPELIVGTKSMLDRIEVDTEKLEVSPDVYAFLSEEVTPQGVLAVIKIPDLTPKISTASCILLDRVRDPGNLGGIIRTAAAAGINDVYLYGCADPFNPKAVRATMSGIYAVNVYESDDIDLLLKVIDKPIVVADADGENVFSLTTCGNFCLVIGNEANGVSDYLMQKADKKISIPMQNGIESLNAGVSAGILMYVLNEKRR